MGLNSITAENQAVGKTPFATECQESIGRALFRAKQVVLFRKKKRGASANATWVVGQHSTLNWPTQHYVLADAPRCGSQRTAFQPKNL